MKQAKRKYVRRAEKSISAPPQDKMMKDAPNKRVCSRCGRETASMVCPKCRGVTRIKG